MESNNELISNYSQELNNSLWYNNVNASSIKKLDDFLELEKENNKIEPWIKLNRTIKIAKLITFIDKYTETHPEYNFEKQLLVNFFRSCLDRNRLNKVKDVVYDKSNGEIIDIPGLTFISSNNTFILKSSDKKRVSTLNNLSRI